MKKIFCFKAMRTVMSAFLAAVMLIGNIPVQGVCAANGQGNTMKASYVEKMENAPGVDLETYADNSVMFNLSDYIREDEEISVIITVDVPNLMDVYEGTDKTMSFAEFALESEAAAAIEAQIASEKARILAVLEEQGVVCTAGADYTVLTSGFEIEIQAKDYAAVCMSLGEGESATVSEVYRTMETQLPENTVNVCQTGIIKGGDSGYDGSGTVVAVLDTGLDSDHTAFSVDNFTSDNLALTYDDVAKVMKQTKAYELAGRLSVDDVYMNEKVPFGYDYADNDSAPYSIHNNHGTHVSGIISGIDDTIIGVAPNAQLVTMKVFSDVMDTARTSWILDALEDCVLLGVDVINMSLGTACGFAREDMEELERGVYEKIRQAGISMVVAASNSYNSAYGSLKSGNVGLTSNPDTGTVASPGTYAGVMSVASADGELRIGEEQTSGPFIPDFSSWGPTPSLQIKPEITAYGGNILSSVTGGGYDRLSGTSMACPNLAGVMLLMREYVAENFYAIANDDVAIHAMANRLMMSTADIIMNTNGQPYAVRKQGAGLVNLLNAINTTACIITKDEDGRDMDKTKLELGDDPEKTGVYTMSFSVENFGDRNLTYEIGSWVMTEGVSETTVTEMAHILTGATLAVNSVEGGKVNGTKLSVDKGQKADVTVTITLSDEDKAYLDSSFPNGMYVEGFITLTASEGAEIDLNVPYLAFYGDWNKAPLFDLDYYTTNVDELDDSIAVEDKTVADVYATRPIGGVSEDYVSCLGSYYFLQDPRDMMISANRDHISLSNKEGTIHALRFVWAGLLRNARRIEVSITDDTTGEVIFETVDTDVRKSYGGGGIIYPANIEIGFDTQEYNLSNNTRYTVKLVGYLDYGNGGLEANENSTFEFPLTVDFEAPTITDVEFYAEYDETLRKNRLYAKAHVFDNHYAMAAQLGYAVNGTDADGNLTPEILAFEQFMTPIFSRRNATTVVNFELTDYIYQIKENAMNGNSFCLTLYDYALNHATYEIGLPDDFDYFYLEELIEETIPFVSMEAASGAMVTEEATDAETVAMGSVFKKGLTLSPCEVYSLEPAVYPENQWGELLEFSSSDPDIVRIVNNKLVAASSGEAVIEVRNPGSNQSITFPVTVLREEDAGYRHYDKPVADVFTLTGYETLKAYYMLNSEDKLIGDTGDKRFFEGDYRLSMYPSESLQLTYILDAYFPEDTKVEFTSSDEGIVTVAENGTVVAQEEGFASVTVKVMMDARSTCYCETVSVEVKDPFVTSGASLSHYYGNGGLVTIPTRLKLREIGSFAFSNFAYIPKTEEELVFDDTETSKQCPVGEDTITKVIIPEGVEKINRYAFANLTGLEEIVLPSTLRSIEYGAFYGCSALEKITFSSENNLQIISHHAFENCNLQGTLELPAICAISDYAFAGNRMMEGIKLSDTLLSIGEYAFAGCKALKNVTIESSKVKYGPYAFTGCEALESFYVNAAVLPAGMFCACDKLKTVTIGPDVKTIGEFAFRDTGVRIFEIRDGNKTYKVQTSDKILSADGKTLIAVSPLVRGEVDASVLGTDVTAIGDGAFSHNTKVTAVNLPNVTSVGDYAFGFSGQITSVTLGQLTNIGDYAFFETAITEMPQFTAETVIGKYAFSRSKLLTVTIPDGMTVAEGVFSECLNLETVTIGNDVTLEKYAFNMREDNLFAIRNCSEDDETYACGAFAGGIDELTIGDNAVLGDNAFAGNVDLETVNLGANADIGCMAFYNACNLKNIDLSQAKAIGDFAFAYCDEMTDVILSQTVTGIPQYAFAGCIALETIDLSKIGTVGDYAFLGNGALQTVDLSSAESIGEYAFGYCKALKDVTLNENGTDIAEGAFSYCEALTGAKNLNCSENIGAYSFAHSAVTEADLSGAVVIDDFAFLKESLTPFRVTLGENLTTLGDNPFAMCVLEPFAIEKTQSFDCAESTEYTYDLSDTVKIIDGALYCIGQKGMTLIAYAGDETVDMKVAADTIRIGSYAFTGTGVQMVTMPDTTTSIGHKAFYLCDDLHTVVFRSNHAPILEEAFDAAYYESFEHIPGTGDYGSYADYDGADMQINGMGMLPYYMWNVREGMYSNVFYGANFVDYVGYVEDKLTMVRPVNGEGYDSYIYGQYFDMAIDGVQAAYETETAKAPASESKESKRGTGAVIAILAVLLGGGAGGCFFLRKRKTAGFYAEMEGTSAEQTEE